MIHSVFSGSRHGCFGLAAASPRTRVPHRLLLALFLGISLQTFPALASEIRIDATSTRVINEVYVVDAVLSCTFSDEAIEALDSGVPITIAIEIALKRKRDFLWDATMTTLRQGYRLQHHALSEQYLLSNLATGTIESFPTREDAVRALERITAIPLIEASNLDPKEVYIARMRANLDIEALPTPMRPLAYLSSDWWMFSHWHHWELRP